MKGVKRIERPSANLTNFGDTFSFHVSLEMDEDSQDSTVEVNVDSNDSRALSFGIAEIDGDSEEIYSALPSVFEDDISPSASLSVTLKQS